MTTERRDSWACSQTDETNEEESMSEEPSLSEYRQQLISYAETLAKANHADIAQRIDKSSEAEMVKHFTDGNLEKRFLKLNDQLEFVAEFYDESEWEDFIVDYIKSKPLAAYDTGCSDGENFLLWLGQTTNPTAEQRDAILCQQARHAVEEVARSNRLKHLHFQDLYSLAEQMISEWSQKENLKMVLNPIHVYETFQTTALLDEEDDLPASVIFYPFQGDIRTALLEPEGEQLISLLKSKGPQTFESLIIERVDITREEILELSKDLMEMGLIAFG